MFGPEDRKPHVENARVDSRIQVSLVIVGEVVILPPCRKTAASAGEDLNSKPEGDGVVELGRAEDRYLAVEVEETQTAIREWLHPLRPEVTLHADRTGTGTVDCCSGIRE